MKRVTLAVILGVLVCLTDAGQAVAVPITYRFSVKEPQITSHDMNIRHRATIQAETARILALLDQRIKDKKVLARARKKLLTLHPREIRLLSALCHRITSNKRATSSEFLYSLVTTLIVFS